VATIDWFPTLKNKRIFDYVKSAAQMRQAMTYLSPEELAHDVQFVMMEGVMWLAETEAP